ncbi:MAG: toxic anion resistance protein [Lachnospiraceae bacterium]|nr:toxic anion resistance protein [Lachnospiraceae bacterium]
MENEINEMNIEEIPTLTFDVIDEVPVVETIMPENSSAETKKVVEKEVTTLAQTQLTPKEQEMVKAFVDKIDLNNTNAVLQYGASTQKKMADFSNKALTNIKTKDMGEIGEMITGLVTELKSFDVEEESGGFLNFFKKKANSLTNLKAKYDKAEVNVAKISDALESHQVQLLKDVEFLDKMYDLNLNYFKEISMYIIAGKEKLEIARNTELEELKQKALASGLPEDAQVVKDFENMCERFEKKINDLELSRMIALQTAPQIRLIQNSDTVMVDKIQSTLVNTIPLWKNQMAIAIGIQHSTDAAMAQRQVSDMTNELLRKNASALKVATIETAKEAERGIVDMETLRNTNESLITTLDEVMRIQTEGREKRRQAEIDLQNMENQLKDKLLTITVNAQKEQAEEV